jgi:hypothetical protein
VLLVCSYGGAEEEQECIRNQLQRPRSNRCQAAAASAAAAVVVTAAAATAAASTGHAATAAAPTEGGGEQLQVEALEGSYRR